MKVVKLSDPHRVVVTTSRALPQWRHETTLTPREAKQLASELRKAAIGPSRKRRAPKADPAEPPLPLHHVRSIV